MALVCLCHGVSDRIVQHAIDEGADSIDEIGARCAAGSSCAGCHDTLDELICAGLEVRRPSAA